MIRRSPAPGRSPHRKAVPVVSLSRCLPARLLTTLAAVLLLLAFPGPARADEEKSTQAAVLVEQAIALIANDAGDARVADGIQDALNAPDQQGTNAADVRAALALIERPGHSPTATAEARALLLTSIGGRLPSAKVSGFAVGTETGTSTVLDEYRPARGISDSGDAALLGIAVAAIVLGLYLARRWRPPHTIRALEHPVPPPTTAPTKQEER